MSATAIQAVYGEEPRTDGEVPMMAFVGFDGVTKIVRRLEEIYADFGIVWYDVYVGDFLLKSFNARYVSVIQYMEIT